MISEQIEIEQNISKWITFPNATNMGRYSYSYNLPEKLNSWLISTAGTQSIFDNVSDWREHSEMYGTSGQAKDFANRSQIFYGVHIPNKPPYIENPDFLWIVPTSETSKEGTTFEYGSIQKKKRNAAAISLFQSWISETTDYDKKVWPKVRESLKSFSLSRRRTVED
jgi:hypothetical protein